MNKNIYKILTLIMLLTFGCLFIKGYLYKEEIEKYKKKTICKFVYCRNAPKTSSSYFKYQVNNKFYKNSYGQCPEDIDKKINKFYILYYSSKDPNKIEVNLSNQITDSALILKAGFTEKDISD